MATFSAVLYSSTLDKFYEAVAFLAAARARGDTALLFLRGPALSAFTQDRWEMPPAFASESVFHFDGKTPMEFLKDLHGHGKIRLYACSAWVRLLGLDNAAVAARVDAVIGLVAFLSQSQGGPVLSF